MKRILAALFLSLWAGLALASSTEQWVAGNGSLGLTWTQVCGSEAFSLAQGNAILCTTNVTNSTDLNIFSGFSGSFGSETSGAGSPTIAVYIYPKNQDGTTYGDGLFGSAAAGPPNPNYYVCYIPVNPSVTAPIVGDCGSTPIVLPPSDFKIVLYNNSGAALASSAVVLKMWTFNRQQH